MRVSFICKDDFNLGAAYVIAYLKQLGHEVRLFLDLDPRLTLPPSSILKSDPDLVAISCVTANKDWALSLADKIRAGFPSTRILFGGVHPTLCPEDFKDYEVCVGDGIKYFGGEFNPDKLWPDREAFLEKLPPVHRAYQIFMTGLGCPFRCSYCNNHQLHRKLVRRQVGNCIEELSYLKERGLRYVLFDDDIFILNRNWLSDFLKQYKARVNLPFTCFGHSKYINEENTRLLKESNCQCVWLGVQSGSQDLRHRILNRKETNQEIKDACRIIKQNKLKLMVDHIFGIPQSNYDTIIESYNLYKEVQPDIINCYELLYFPKAEINKYGESKAKYQKEGGRYFKKYAKAFTSLPLQYN